MSTATLKNLHVPLPDELNRELRAEAKRSGQPATELAREAIRNLLEHRKRETLHSEIAAYATAVAGTQQDLDSDLEAASVEHLLDAKDSPK
jgi:metal-responsive CopG/Arc/MetJ family transcriptional regulator